MDAERKAQEGERAKMQADFEAQMKALNAEIQNKQNDE
jgi:Skp family chaperone for outer membrane proteins